MLSEKYRYDSELTMFLEVRELWVEGDGAIFCFSSQNALYIVKMKRLYEKANTARKGDYEFHVRHYGVSFYIKDRKDGTKLLTRVCTKGYSLWARHKEK